MNVTKRKSEVLKEIDTKILATLDEDVVNNEIDTSSDFFLQIFRDHFRNQFGFKERFEG